MKSTGQLVRFCEDHMGSGLHGEMDVRHITVKH